MFPTTPVLVTGLLIEDPITHMGNAVGNSGSHLKSDGTSIFAASAFSSGYWDQFTVVDFEVYATIQDATGAQIQLFWRVGNPGFSTFQGYNIVFNQGSTDVAWHTDLAYVTDTFLASPLAAGDQIGVQGIGSLFTLYVNGVSQGTWTDSTYKSGFIGAYTEKASGPVFTNFGGGGLNIPPNFNSRPLIMKGP